MDIRLCIWYATGVLIMMYHIRKDGVPVSCCKDYVLLIANGISRGECKDIPIAECATLESAEINATKFRELYPDSTISIEKGIDPFLLSKSIDGEA